MTPTKRNRHTGKTNRPKRLSRRPACHRACPDCGSTRFRKSRARYAIKTDRDGETRISSHQGDRFECSACGKVVG